RHGRRAFGARRSPAWLRPRRHGAPGLLARAREAARLARLPGRRTLDRGELSLLQRRPDRARTRRDPLSPAWKVTARNRADSQSGAPSPPAARRAPGGNAPLAPA